MKKLELFECEFCREQYDNEHDCKKCEDNHISPKGIIAQDYYTHCDSKNYPHTITVLMEDGKEIRYAKY